MIRIVLFLISVLAVAWGFAWVADRPGEIAITWMGYRVETSVIVAAFAVAALVLVILVIWSIVRPFCIRPSRCRCSSAIGAPSKAILPLAVA